MSSKEGFKSKARLRLDSCVQVEALNELCNYGGGLGKEEDVTVTEVKHGQLIVSKYV